MGWDSLFLLANYWAIACWIALVFLPRGPRTLALILYLGVALLCYAVGTLADFEGAKFLVDVSPVLVIIALSSAVFTWFDRR